MAILHGLLKNDRQKTYEDHLVSVLFTVLRPRTGEAPGATPQPTPTELVADTAASGHFEIVLPDSPITTVLSLRVLSPAGDILATASVLAADLQRSLGTEESPGVVIVAEPRTAGAALVARPSKIDGRVLHREGVRQIANRQVILFAHRKGDVLDLGEVVLVARTDAQGFFFAEHPHFSEDTFDAAFAVVAGTRSVTGELSVPVRLEAGTLPRHVLLVVDLQEESAGDDCDCLHFVPRVPGHNDLLTSPVYSVELGGKCVRLTAPNRALEEFTYFTAVRVTEPEVFDLSSLNGSRNSDGHFEEPPRFSLSPRTRRAIDVDHPLPWEFDWDPGNASPLSSALPQAVTIARGHLLKIRQSFRADGYSLGELLYSLPLAPGQKKRLAVVNWERRDELFRSESLEETERLANSLSRDRDIHEIVQSSLSDHIEAGSNSKTFGFGTGAGGALSFLGGLFGLGGVVGDAFGAGRSEQSSFQTSSRDISASSLNRLNDRVAQAASAIRGQRATVVQSVTEGEAVRVQTEVIANYNHCHALTIQYFEVLRHFQVANEIVDVTECLFVPLVISPFQPEPERVIHGREVLQRVLLEPSLDGGFDALDRRLGNWAQSGFPAARYADEDVVDVTGRFEATFQIERPADNQDGTYNDDAWRWVRIALGTSPSSDDFDSKLFFAFYLARSSDPKERDRVFTDLLGEALIRAYLKGLQLHVAPTGRASIFVPAPSSRDGTAVPSPPGSTFQPPPPPRPGTLVPPVLTAPPIVTSEPVVAPHVGRSIPIEATLLPPYASGGTLRVAIHLTPSGVDNLQATPLKRSNIGRVYLGWEPEGRIRIGAFLAMRPHVRMAIQTGSLRYRTRFDDYALARLDGEIASLHAEVDADAPLDPEEQRNPRADDVALSDRLLRHLDQNAEYYTRALWLFMSPDRRFLLLDGILAEPGGRSVASLVENRVVGIVGNSLVMPVTSGVRLTDPRVDLHSLYDVSGPPPPPVRISLPTAGVFAEAVPGGCNACETKDETRFWRFEESRIPDDPTAIAPIDTQRTIGSADLRPSGFADPLVKSTDFSKLVAPQSTSLADLLAATAAQNTFRDITGVEQTQKNAIGALQASFDQVQALTGEAADLVKQQMQFADGNTDKSLAAIRNAKSAGFIDDKQANQLANKLLDRVAGGKGKGKGKGDGDDSVTADKGVKGAIDSATKSKKSSVKIKNDKGSIATSKTDKDDEDKGEKKADGEAKADGEK